MCKIFIFLTLAAVMSACSSAPGTSDSTNGNKIQTNNSTETSAVQNVSANSGATVEAEKKNREIFTKNENQNVPIVVRNPADDKDNNYNGRIAPDDSTFKSEMNAKGQFLETRTFNNHPQLLKAEHYSAEKKILVYLKSGKVVEVPADKLPTFQATVPGTILQAAGVQIKEAPATGYKDGKQPVEQKKDN